MLEIGGGVYEFPVPRNRARRRQLTPEAGLERIERTLSRIRSQMDKQVRR